MTLLQRFSFPAGLCTNGHQLLPKPNILELPKRISQPKMMMSAMPSRLNPTSRRSASSQMKAALVGAANPRISSPASAVQQGHALRRDGAWPLMPWAVPGSAKTILSSRSSYVAAKAMTADTEAAGSPAASENDAEMQLQLYNSMTRKKEQFTPRESSGRDVSMYVCGVTVYDYSHIGHARVYVAFDILYRTLMRLGYNVTYCRNFTDIDDKIIARAAERDEDPLALSERFIHEFHADMERLGCLSPTMEPKATEHVDDIIAMIETIIGNGHAYAVEGDVFFDVASLPNYGRLSGRKQEDNRAGERVAVDSRKKSPEDFALWKSAKPGEPTWESPWGPGRPGWHIECSSMIRKLMGPVIDIHGGGQDLTFPHHENELAQSQAASCGCSDEQHLHNGQDFVRYWVHNGFVNVDSEKMSKSLGNFFTIRDVLELYHPVALRWFLVGTQYRAGLNYTQRALEEASDRIYSLLQTLLDSTKILSEAEGGSSSAAVNNEIEQAVASALCDDLNTAVAVAQLSDPLTAMNDLLYTKKGRKDKARVEKLSALQQGMTSALEMLGFDVSDPEALLGEFRELALKRADMTEEGVQEAIEQRAEARANKDYARGDEIRDGLSARGIVLMDVPGGTTWRPAPRLDVASEDEAP